MLKRRAGVVLLTVILLAGGSLAVAQVGTPERFTFTPASVPAGTGQKEPMDLVVTRWSNDEERTRVVDAAAEGTQRLSRAIAEGWDAGYVQLPGNLRYTLRYAHRVPRPDGGYDIVVAADRPIWVWWDSSRTADATKQDFAVIHVRVNKEGVGEGKISTSTSRIGTDKQAKTIVLDNFTNEPTFMTDVRRQRAAAGTTSRL